MTVFDANAISYQKIFVDTLWLSFDLSESDTNGLRNIFSSQEYN